jgi:glycosyltransferase involved in cell wall biosynthesis
VGGPGTPDQEQYFAEVKQLAQDLGLSSLVTFHGPRPHAETVAFFHAAHVFVSTATNGSFDKAMGDAMATGLPLVACNKAMEEVLGDLRTTLMFPEHDVDRLVEQLIPILNMTQEERNRLGESLREIIVQKHSLQTFAGRILSYLA